MALSDILSDIYASLSFTEIHAETPPQEEEPDEGGDDDKEESEAKGGEEDGDADGGEGSDEGGDDEGGEEEEEEEEEEEPEDPFPKLQEGTPLAFLTSCMVKCARSYPNCYHLPRPCRIPSTYNSFPPAASSTALPSHQLMLHLSKRAYSSSMTSNGTIF